MSRLHIVLVDPIAYGGGSKIATARMLENLDPKLGRVTIVTRDPASWANTAARISPLFESRLLACRDRGIAYFLRHALIVCSLIWARIRHGRFDRAVGASGPGIDLSLYLGRRLFGYRIIQLVHGPVASSKTIGRALLSADRVFYLESSGDSLLRALQTVQSAAESRRTLASSRFLQFSNGLAEQQWPTPSSEANGRIFWASSLLKWKGLQTLLTTLKLFSTANRPQAHICYIRPKDTGLELGPGPVELERVHWYEDPSDLDRIRAGCGIFVSTSRAEPFGLSILESMAAGLAVVIPRDDAYWDRHLQDGRHCLKYRPEDPADLAEKILRLTEDRQLASRLGRRARLIARQYRADRVYRQFVECLTRPPEDGAAPAATVTGEVDHAQV